MLLNSTLQPIGDFGGGGLKRNVCQLVDWRFYSEPVVSLGLQGANGKYSPRSDLSSAHHLGQQSLRIRRGGRE
jgi:hypothetical protein